MIAKDLGIPAENLGIDTGNSEELQKCLKR